MPQTCPIQPMVLIYYTVISDNLLTRGIEKGEENGTGMLFRKPHYLGIL